MNKKMCLFLTAAFSFSGVAAAAAAPAAEPYYICHTDYDNPLFDPDAEWFYKVEYPLGEITPLYAGKKAVFLEINGELVGADVVIQDGKAMAPSALLCEKLGVKQEAEGLVPIREFCEGQGADVIYIRKGYMPLGNPLVSVDNRQKDVTKEDAVRLAKASLEAAYAAAPENTKHDPAEESFRNQMKAVRERIDQTHYLGESASFWIIAGPYPLLVDKCDGTVYFKSLSKPGHGSYLEYMGVLTSDSTDLSNVALVPYEEEYSFNQ